MVVGELLLISIHSYVLMFFPFTVLITWYIFVTFKLQKNVDFLLPPLYPSPSTSTSYYYPFIVQLYVLTLFQLIYVAIVVIYRQSNNEVYFIDWELSNTAHELEPEKTGPKKSKSMTGT